MEIFDLIFFAYLYFYISFRCLEHFKIPVGYLFDRLYVKKQKLTRKDVE